MKDDNLTTYGGVYVIWNTICDKFRFYIGSAVSFAQRKNEHFRKLRCGKHHNKYLQRAWNKYGEESFVFEPVENICDLNQIKVREQGWIDTYNLKKDLYNINPNAESWLGRTHSKETKEKIRKSLTGRKGRKHTKKTKEEMSARQQGKNNSFYNKTHTLEAKEKMRQASLNKRHSLESKDKISANQPYKKSVVQIDPDTDDVIAIFDSIAEAARQTNTNKACISSICNNSPKLVKGKYYVRKTTGGYKWKFVSDLENLENEY